MLDCRNTAATSTTIHEPSTTNLWLKHQSASLRIDDHLHYCPRGSRTSSSDARQEAPRCHRPRRCTYGADRYSRGSSEVCPGAMRPLSYASTTSCVRSRAFTLARIRETCDFVVSGLI